MCILLSLLGSTLSASLWPAPLNYSAGPDFRALLPSELHFQHTCTGAHLNELLIIYEQFYNMQGGSQVTLNIGDCELVAATGVNQKYEIRVNQSSISLNAQHYPGIVRALQTFFHLFQQGGIYVPTHVVDGPVYPHRGIMLDTSRHFLSLPILKQAIDGCLMNKLNVLHWHMVDDDSFPILLDEVDVNKSSFGSFYTKTQIKELVHYAMVRGVRIIPQIDTPSHTWSWSRAFSDQNSFMLCNQIFGQMDPTLQGTYSRMQSVIRQVVDLFPDQFLHLGGDQVQQWCWDKRPTIKQFMKKHGLQDYNALQVYYRKRQKQILRGFTNKTFLYWSNTLKELDWYQHDDVAHWWDGIGQNDNRNGTSTKSVQKVVLSYFDKTYLDAGYVGGRGIVTWRDVYNNYLGFPWAKVEVLGAQVALWSQANNDFTTSRKLWIRGSALAERVWNGKVLGENVNYKEIVGRLSEQRKRMQSRKIECSPITVELCQRQPEICFS